MFSRQITTIQYLLKSIAVLVQHVLFPLSYKKVIPGCFAILLSASVMSAQPQSEGMSLVGRWARGQYRSIEAFHDQITYACGSTLFIMNIDDSEEPVVLSTLVLWYPIRDIAVEGDYIFVLTKYNGFVVVDASDAINPRIISEIYTFEGELIDVRNGIAMISYIIRQGHSQNVTAGFKLYDVSSPEEPVELSHTELGIRSIGYTIEDLYIDDSFVYLADTEFVLRIYDITNLEEPFQICEIDCREQGGLGSFLVADNLLFMQNRIYDISNVDRPELISTYNYPLGGFYAISDSLLFTAGTGFDIYNIANLDSVKRVFRTDVREHGITNVSVADMVVKNRTCFTISNNKGLSIFSFEDVENPELLFYKQDGGSLYKTLIWEDRMYSYEGTSRLFSIDISDPSNPVENRHELHLDNSNEWRNTPEFLQYDNYLYLFGDDAMRIVDCSDPEDMFETGEIIDINGPIQEALIEGERLYITCDNVQLKIFDLHSPTEPELLTSFQIPGRVWIRQFAKKDQFVFVNSSGRIFILDTHNTDDIALVAQIEVQGNITDLLVDGNFLYACCGWWTGEIYLGNLSVIDISNPNQPELIGYYVPDDIFYRSMAKIGDHIFIAAEKNGVRMIDVSNPTDPEEAGYYNYYAGDVIAKDSLIYCTAYGEELFILREGDPQFVSNNNVNESISPVPLWVYPNPFNSSTKVSYSIPHPGNLSINLYDLQGRSITQEVFTVSQAGRFSKVFDLSDYPTGVYFLEMEFDSIVKRQKLVLIR